MNWGGLSVLAGLVAIAAAAPWWVGAGAALIAAVWWAARLR